MGYPHRMEDPNLYLWSTAFSSFFGAVGGALVALFIGVATSWRESVRRERAAVEGLLADLHMRRSLAPNHGRTVRHRTARRLLDYTRANSSVLEIRTNISSVRRTLRPKSKSFEHLNRMVRACNDYPETSFREPGLYSTQLNTLRCQLTDSMRELDRLNRLGVPDLTPGDGALSNSI